MFLYLDPQYFAITENTTVFTKINMVELYTISKVNVKEINYKIINNTFTEISLIPI